MYPQKKVQTGTGDFWLEAEARFAPPAGISQFLEKALTAAFARGLRLEFVHFHALIDAFEANRDSWPSFPPLFDPRLNQLDERNSFCILGRDAEGQVVATQAARAYSWPHTTFYEAATSLELFADDPSILRASGSTCEVTAQSTHGVSGNVVYSGAAWYHPTFRKKQLAYILPRISRALSFARWQSTFAVSLQAEAVVAGGMAQRVGFRNVDWDVNIAAAEMPRTRFAFVSIDAASMMLDFIDFAANFDAKIDLGVERRRA